MTKLLEIKKQIFRFVGEYETYLKFVNKFLVALALFCLIDATVGFMENISTFPVALLMALVCCLLPQWVTLVAAAGLVLGNLYVLSTEVAVTALLIFLVVILVYFRFSPKDGMLFLLTPILFAFHIPYILPIGAGLLKDKYSAGAVASGTLIFFFINGIYENVTALQATVAGSSDVTAAKMTITAGQLLANKEMYVTVVVFILSVIVVNTIRKLTIDHAWKVAIVSGVLLQVSGLFAGYLLFDITGKTFEMIVGNIIALVLGFVLEFMFMDLDYSRTERVQFEDDEYYYYVKAVPKKMVASSDKSVKKFGGFSMREKKKEKGNEAGTKISRRQIAKELDIDEKYLR